MRIERLDLLRFGHFTDVSIPLPRSPRDFHVIVGPNEAGKSTVRSAILDLLFGIEPRSSYDFLHPKADLCLGASISHAGRVFDFQRVKKTRSLTDPAGATLPDDSLGAFLGGANRDSYGQMFGLDHEHLVSGGRDILKASNDVGRILFQSATGLSSLGDVRDSLAAEADKLWGKRRSGEREYFKGLASLEEADAELKRVSVKAKDWADTRQRVGSLTCELHELQAKYDDLERERIRLDRTRRVARFLRDHEAASRGIAALGQVAALPPNAAQQLAEAEAAMATAKTLTSQASRNLDATRSELAALHVDEDVLRHSQAIEALAKRRQQTEPYERDLAKRDVEVATYWTTVRDAVRQLGWTDDEERALRARLPPLPVRRTLANLIKEHGAIRQAVAAASEAESDKRRELADIDRDLAQQSTTHVPAELRAALEAAARLGDVGAATQREATKAARARRELAAAEASLGEWPLALPALRSLALPATEVVRKLRADHELLEQQQRAAADKRNELRGDVSAAELAMEQYKRSHQPVTLEDLTTIRGARDRVWADIKTGVRGIDAAGSEYERAVADADRLADLRHDRASEAAELQLRLDKLAELTQHLVHAEARCAGIAEELTGAAEAWRGHASKLGLPSLPLLAWEQWHAARDKVLTAAEAADLADYDAKQLKEAVGVATEDLRCALLAAGRAAATEARLDVLASEAKALIEASVSSKARLEELTRQAAKGRRALADLAESSERARAALDVWTGSWSVATRQAGLSGLDSGAVEGALVLFEDIDAKLKAIQDVRENRIQTMRRDLDDLDAQARALADVLAPELAGRPAPEVSLSLSARLSHAADAKKTAERLEADARKHARQVEEAGASLEQAMASLAPLMQTAGAADPSGLRLLVDRSDAWRRLRAEADEAQEAAESAGDNLSLAQLADEASGADLAAITERVGEIARIQQAAWEKLAALSASLTTAQGELGRLAGQDDAVCAATRRQEALARMADAAERYIKVRVAEKVLGWAVERYRESKQGPMLTRASEVFSGLTLGAFARLSVDFGSDPPKLTGVRPDKRTVDTERMSEGTRDQLYLALRLAALELQVDHAHPLPFLADDLFVKFDDARARAGLEALARLSERTQVIFLTHHAHLLPAVRDVLGEHASVIALPR